jgi:hypothetical protein
MLYRRMVLWLLAVFTVLAGLIAYRLLPDGSDLLSLPALRFGTGSELGLALMLVLNNLLPLVIIGGLTWVAAFHPVRKTPSTLKALKLAAAAGALGLAGLLLYRKASAAGSAAAILAGQSGTEPGLALLISQLPHRLPEAAGLLMILAAPIYWLIRSAQVSSPRRSSFEAWLEVKGLAAPSLVLLALAAIVEVYLTPISTAFMLK